MKAPERIETARLVLQRPTAEDVPEIFKRYASDAEVTKYVVWPRHKTIGETEGFLRFSEAEWGRWPAGPYLIRSLEGVLLGSTGLGFEWAEHASTGYVLAVDAWKKGIATDALRTIVNISGPLGVKRMYAMVHVDHRASARVLEKAGFTQEKRIEKHVTFPNLGAEGPSDVFYYGLNLQP